MCGPTKPWGTHECSKESGPCSAAKQGRSLCVAPLKCLTSRPKPCPSGLGSKNEPSSARVCPKGSGPRSAAKQGRSLCVAPLNPSGPMSAIRSRGHVGPHTQNDVATGSAPTSEPASAEKPGRQQEEASSPARVSSSPPAFLQFPKEEVLQKAPGPKPSSGLFGSAPARCGPGPSLLPKSQPKAKGREDPQPSSQPKLAQFFVAQTRKASTSSHTLASPAHPVPVP